MDISKELGDLYRRDKQYANARNSYLRAIGTGFDSAELYRNLAISTKGWMKMNKQKYISKPHWNVTLMTHLP